MKLVSLEFLEQIKVLHSTIQLIRGNIVTEKHVSVGVYE